MCLGLVVVRRVGKRWFAVETTDEDSCFDNYVDEKKVRDFVRKCVNPFAKREEAILAAHEKGKPVTEVDAIEHVFTPEIERQIETQMAAYRRKLLTNAKRFAQNGDSGVWIDDAAFLHAAQTTKPPFYGEGRDG